MRPKPRRQSMGHHFEDAADGIAGPVNLVHDQLHLLLGAGIHATEEYFGAAAQLDQFAPFDGAIEAAGADRDHVAQNLDTEVPEKLLDDRADGDTRRGFASASPFENVTGLGKIVFNSAGEVGMPGPGTR